MRTIHSNRTPLALLYLILYTQTCLATADENHRRQEAIPNATYLEDLKTQDSEPVGLTLAGRQFTETPPPASSTIFVGSPTITEISTTTTRTRETFFPPPPSSDPTRSADLNTTTTTSTSTSISSPSGTTSSSTTFIDQNTTLIATSRGQTLTITGSSFPSASGTVDGAEFADPTASFIIYPNNSDVYARMQDLKRFGLAAIVLLVINGLLLSAALGFAIYIYFKHFHGQKPTYAPSSAFSSSSASLIPNKRQSKATWATPSLSGTVPRALAGKQIPSHHYARRSWDQVTTIASTSTESERRRRQRVSRVEEESEDASLADTDARDPTRRSLQSSMAETDTSMIRSSSGVSVALESNSGRGTGVR